MFRARDLLVRQRTQIINAIRDHVAEYGKVAPKGVCYVERLVSAIDDPESELPPAARVSLKILTEGLAKLADQIAVLDREIANRVREDPIARRLMTIPGVGPITIRLGDHQLLKSALALKGASTEGKRTLYMAKRF